MAQIARRVQLKAEILQAFGAYTRDAETAMQQTQHGSRPLLWSDADSDRAKQVRKGDIVAQYCRPTPESLICTLQATRQALIGT
jgi:hypothetical protein